MTSRWRSTKRGAPAGPGTVKTCMAGVGRGSAGTCGSAGRLGGVALGLDRAGTGGRALREDAGQVEDAARAARDLDGLAAGVGDEGAERVVVAQLAARLAEQVRDGVPAAGDQQQVGGELPAPRGLVRTGRRSRR